MEIGSTISLQMLRVGIVAAGLTISGCSTVSQIVQDPRSAYILASDPCSSFREPFVQIREKQRRQIVNWAATGAFAAATAVILGKDTSTKNIALSFVGGALVGAVTGYYYNLTKRESQTNELRSTIFTDAKLDAGESDELVAGVSSLNGCRMKSINEIATGLQAGTLSQEDARESLSLIKRYSQLDNKLVGSVSEGLTKRSTIYVSALQLSGADDADKYITQAEAYQPIVRKPKYTVSRKASSQPEPKPITIKKRSKSNENSVIATAKGAAELDAMVIAHVQSVDDAIEDIESVLL